jgi:serine protease Do
MSLRKGLILGTGMLLILVAVIFGYRAASDRNSARMRQDSPKGFVQKVPGDFSALAGRVQQSVVNISTENGGSGSRDDSPALFDRSNPFDMFSSGREEGRSSLGSGFIIRSDGYILTNSHIVENASRINVKLSDNRITEAVVAGTDPKSDLALLKIRDQNLPVLPLAPSDDIAIGDWVLAFGSPFGLEQTITHGIISAKGRVAASELYDTLLQTDAAINPGNSGGPLVNLRGEVVGVNTLIRIPGHTIGGIGFAIPAPTVRQVYEHLLKSGKVTRGWIGIRIQEITPAIARSFNLRDPEGALVADVVSDGPAAKAGLKSGDIILKFNQQRVRSAHDLLMAVADSKVGSSAHLTMTRNGIELSVDVPVGERPSAVAGIFTDPGKPGKLGITVENVTPEVRAEMHLRSDGGVLVTEVTPGSSADDGGVLPGDVIHSINREPVSKAADLLSVLHNLEENSTVMLGIERHGKRLYLAFQLSS